MTDHIEDPRQPADPHPNSWDEQGESERDFYMRNNVCDFLHWILDSAPKGTRLSDGDCISLVTLDLDLTDEFETYCRRQWKESQGVE